MQEVFLGDYIRKRRMELGLSQQELCEGICEPITISRLENGKQTPSRNNINALLQRLGLPGDRFYALLSKQEEQVELLKKEIVSCNVQFQKALDTEQPAILKTAYKKIAELEAIAEKDDNLLQQFILRSKVLLGRENGEPYTLDEQLELLLKVIRITVPKFDLEQVNSFLYCLNEVKIINQIANCFAQKEDYLGAISIYRQLMHYVETHYANIMESGGLLPLVAGNYALALYESKHYQDALKIAELGRQACIQSGSYNMLPIHLHTMALCHYWLGEHKASMELFHQAYYIYRAIGDSNNTEFIREDIQKFYGLTFTY